MGDAGDSEWSSLGELRAQERMHRSETMESYGRSWKIRWNLPMEDAIDGV